MAPHPFVEALCSSVTHILSREAPCVVLNIYMGPFCGCLEEQVKKSSLSVILSLLLSLPNSSALPLPPPPTPSVFAQSKCIRRAGVTPVGVGCLS